MPLKNLRALRDDMRAQEWVITCFPFNYNQGQYFVFVRRYIPNGSGPKYALVELCFADCSDLSRTLVVPANSRKLMPDDLAEFRDYFGIRWVDNPGEFLQQFAERLGPNVPGHVVRLSPVEQEAVRDRLLASDSEDPAKVYCTGVMRNRSSANRTPYNAQKTRMLRPTLFARWENDPAISFRYSIDHEDHRTDEEILRAFTGR
ncbi:DUF6037 family protein [Corynebacterium suicordis]|uniref:DUF6037 family protein n=1 Tax=uncultured Corynebacterium sp. TaxID=159447 RepID=UPI00338E22D4